MITTNKFTPSINILRDANAAFNYIPTPNSTLIFNQILESYKSGAKRSFSIIGSYGTGKSSFLWAVQQSLSKKKNLFVDLDKTIDKILAFEFVSLVGDYNSLIDDFGNALEMAEASPQLIFKDLEHKEQELKKENKGLVILIDEFGKFLEYAAKNNPEKELYFVQQLAEFANDTKKNILFLITLHQGFDAYSLSLDKTQRQEWDKVKGRLKELAFNEPVEQLLLLAAKRINGKATKDKKFSHLFKAIEEAKVFPLRDYFSVEIATQLYPFDILSAAILTLALQRYGQNERSLFSFIDGDEHLGFGSLNADKEGIYHAALVYDYFNYNYYNFLNSKYNPHLANWSAIKTALERIEGIANFDATTLEIAQKLIKIIGLLNLFIPSSARLDKTFLVKYGQYALNLSKDAVESVIDSLEKTHKIITYKRHAHKYALTEGTDLDIQLAIDEAGNLVEQVTNVTDKLNDSFSFPYILAKENYYRFGTPRFFEFKITDKPIEEAPTGEVDGFINLIFSEQLTEAKLKKISSECEEPILFGWYQNTKEIQSYLLEIEKVKRVKADNLSDKVAVRELDSILQHYIKLVNNSVLGNLYSSQSTIVWFFKGKKETFENRKVFHRRLSEICDIAYKKTPTFAFEMINKTKLSGAMLTARKKLLDALVDNHEVKELGFEDDKFPPEKSIYLALLKNTGIHLNTDKIGYLQDPVNSGIESIWCLGEDFLNSTKNNKRKITDFIDSLRRRPFKLKDGLIDFILPIFLFVKRDDFALFEEDRYVPSISKDILELISRNPHKYQIKAFDIDGVRLNLFNSYRTMLQQSQELQFSNKIFIETIRPFLTFYKQLPDYAKTTKRLPQEALALREVIAQAKDPEKSFFEDFPAALGYTATNLYKNNSNLADYTAILQHAIRVLRTAFEELINRFEQCLLNRLGLDNLPFEEYKLRIQERFKKIKPHLLLAHQKPFLQRINSMLDDRRAWLLSIGQACLGKQLEGLTDADEPLLFSKLQHLIHELDNITEVSAKDIDETKEMFFKLNISSLVEGFKNNSDSIRLPKTKEKDIEKIEVKVKKILSDDHDLNIAVLAKLLQEQINHGKKG